MLLRSWRYSLAHLRTLITSLAAILITLVLAGFIAILVDNLIRIWLFEVTAEVVVDGFLFRNYLRLLALPVCWSYQALLYRHARDPEAS